MRLTSGICGALTLAVFLAPGVRANDHQTSLTFSPVHGKMTATNRSPNAVGQSSESTTVVVEESLQPTTTAEAPKPAKIHVTEQRVIEHTTTVDPPKPPKPAKVHVTEQRVIEHTTTVDPPKPPKPAKVKVTRQRVIESTTTVDPPKPAKVHVIKRRVVESTTTEKAPRATSSSTTTAPPQPAAAMPPPVVNQPRAAEPPPPPSVVETVPEPSPQVEETIIATSGTLPATASQVPLVGLLGGLLLAGAVAVRVLRRRFTERPY